MVVLENVSDSWGLALTMMEEDLLIGYDNRHGHHRHIKGAVELVNTTSFEEIEQRFEHEWAAVLEEYNAQRNR